MKIIRVNYKKKINMKVIFEVMKIRCHFAGLFGTSIMASPHLAC